MEKTNGSQEFEKQWCGKSVLTGMLLSTSRWLWTQPLSKYWQIKSKVLNEPLLRDHSGFPDKFIRQICRTILNIEFLWFLATLKAKFYIMSEKIIAIRKNYTCFNSREIWRQIKRMFITLTNNIQIWHGNKVRVWVICLETHKYKVYA